MVLERDRLASKEERHKFIRKWRGERERQGEKKKKKQYDIAI
jgi:hypothetical protein